MNTNTMTKEHSGSDLILKGVCQRPKVSFQELSDVQDFLIRFTHNEI